MKEASLGFRAARNLVRRGKNTTAEIYLMEKFTLKEMRGRSRYNTITKYLDKK